MEACQFLWSVCCRTIAELATQDLASDILGPYLPLDATAPVYPDRVSHQGHNILFQSALWDPHLQEVRIFLDASYDFATDLGFCILGRGTDMVERTQAVLGHLHDGAPQALLHGFVLVCPQPSFVPEWTGIQFRNDYVWPSRLTVHQVPTEKRGPMASCLGTLYGQKDIIHEWLDYHSALGVSHFRIYYSPRHFGDADGPPIEEFERSDVSWQQVMPLDEKHRRLYSQVTMMNECLYRLKYAYDYILMTDIDEFVYINPNRSQHANSLPGFIDSVLPEKTTAAVFLTWAYPTNCQPASSDGTPAYHQHVIREDTPLYPGLNQYCSWMNSRSKMILRPRGVLESCIHNVCLEADGWDKQLQITEDIAFIKHFRNYTFWKENECEPSHLQRDPTM